MILCEWWAHAQPCTAPLHKWWAQVPAAHTNGPPHVHGHSPTSVAARFQTGRGPVVATAWGLGTPDLDTNCTAENKVTKASRTVALKQVCAGKLLFFFLLERGQGIKDDAAIYLREKRSWGR